MPHTINGDGYWSHYLVKREGKWVPSGPLPIDPIKRPGLQGPIDDAFMDRFLMVRPTGMPLNEKVGAWAKSEMNHAVTQWRSAVPRRRPEQGRHGRH